MDEEISTPQKNDNQLSKLEKAICDHLAGISTLVNELESEKNHLSPAEYQSRLDPLLDSANQMQETLEDMFSYDMLANGQIKLDNKVDTLVSGLLETLKGASSRKFDGGVEYVVGEGFPNCLLLDHPHINQIFMKILRDLCKAINPKLLKVRLSNPNTGKSEHGNSHRLTVSITEPEYRGKLAAILAQSRNPVISCVDQIKPAVISIRVAERLLNHAGAQLRKGLNSDKNDVAELHIDIESQAAESDILAIKENLREVEIRRVLIIDEGRYNEITGAQNTLNALNLRCKTVKLDPKSLVPNWQSPLRAWYNCVIVESVEIAKGVREAGFHNVPLILLLGSETSLNIRATMSYRISGLVTTPFSTTDLALVLQKHIVRSIPFPIPGLNILATENNDVNRRETLKTMSNIGQSVRFVNSGVQALEEAKRTRFDLILLRMDEPEMMGVQAAERLKEWEQQNNLPETPTVFLNPSMPGPNSGGPAVLYVR